MEDCIYINRIASFFPNKPVSNEEMEEYLGRIGNIDSRVKPIILKQNGIKSRYYALDKHQHITHSNAELASAAINKLLEKEGKHNHIELLACGTSTPDQILPSHASMVHGLSFDYPMEIYSLSGVCLTGITALKTAYMSIKTGNTNNGVCTASELASPSFLARFYEEEYKNLKELEQKPHLAFEKDFLRYMLSDGASAVLLSNSPNEDASLEINWIELISYANKHPACMYMGADFTEEGVLKGWKEFSEEELLKQSIFSCKQNVRLLNENIIERFVDAIQHSLDKHNVTTDSIRYVIPHISSMYFYHRLEEGILERNLDLPTSKWFTNLTWVGNVGSVAPFAALDELLRTKPLDKGDQILLLVPESGRFSFGIALLTYK